MKRSRLSNGWPQTISYCSVPTIMTSRAMAEVRTKLAPGTPKEVWCQGEMWVGQKNKLTYRWAKKGSRLRATHDQRTQ
jgi:hypothetical protein